MLEFNSYTKFNISGDSYGRSTRKILHTRCFARTRTDYNNLPTAKRRNNNAYCASFFSRSRVDKGIESKDGTVLQYRPTVTLQPAVYCLTTCVTWIQPEITSTDFASSSNSALTISTSSCASIPIPIIQSGNSYWINIQITRKGENKRFARAVGKNQHNNLLLLREALHVPIYILSGRYP